MKLYVIILAAGQGTRMKSDLPKVLCEICNRPMIEYVIETLLAAGFGRTLRSPVFDVGDQVIDRVPVWLKDLAISWFGTNDKPVLLATIGVILAVYSALVGVVALCEPLL